MWVTLNNDLSLLLMAFIWSYLQWTLVRIACALFPASHHRSLSSIRVVQTYPTNAPKKRKRTTQNHHLNHENKLGTLGSPDPDCCRWRYNTQKNCSKSWCMQFVACLRKIRSESKSFLECGNFRCQPTTDTRFSPKFYQMRKNTHLSDLCRSWSLADASAK